MTDNKKGVQVVYCYCGHNLGYDPKRKKNTAHDQFESIILREWCLFALVVKRLQLQLPKDIFHLLLNYINTPTRKLCKTCLKDRCYICERINDFDRHFNNETRRGCSCHDWGYAMWGHMNDPVWTYI